MSDQIKNELNNYLFPCLSNIVMDYAHDPRRYEVNIFIEYIYNLSLNYWAETKMIAYLHPFLLTDIFAKRGSEYEWNRIGKEFKYSPDKDRERGFRKYGGFSMPECSSTGYQCTVTNLTFDEMVNLEHRISKPKLPTIEGMISTRIRSKVFKMQNRLHEFQRKGIRRRTSMKTGQKNI